MDVGAVGLVIYNGLSVFSFSFARHRLPQDLI
jgi:hypothetical protein